jgi:putative membrane protein
MKEKIVLFLKGLAMGAADVVPGVSGGTIAFITGIYDELLDSINAVNLNTLSILRKEGLKAAWKAVNGNFLVVLLAGIFTSILSLANLFKYLLENHPVLLWSFFFGLIAASVLLVGRMIAHWNAVNIIGFIVGTAVSYWLTAVHPGTGVDAYWYIFVSGMIAICAMILPGISGSFILLLLGTYGIVLGAIADHNFVLLAVFAAGCVVGLLSFSRLLSWTLKNYYNVTIAILAGFLLGSLNKIWPWKITTETRINSHGEEVPFLQENILPMDYQPDPQLIPAIGLALVGVLLIFILSKFNPPEKTNA